MSTSHEGHGRVSRRSITSGFAWSVPVILAVTPAHAMAASGIDPGAVSVTYSGACDYTGAGEGYVWLGLLVTVENLTAADIDVDSITESSPWSIYGITPPVSPLPLTIAAGGQEQIWVGLRIPSSRFAGLTPPYLIDLLVGWVPSAGGEGASVPLLATVDAMPTVACFS